MKKKVLLLGSTGSVGKQTLEVIRLFPDDFEVVGLSAHSNITLLTEQAREFSVSQLCCTNARVSQSNIFRGEEGLLQMIAETSADIAVLAVSGGNPAKYARAIIGRGIPLALASKEALVCDGAELMRLSKEHNAPVLPIDSEHSAIWQCLRGRSIADVRALWLTCSGGPFAEKEKFPLDTLRHVSPKQALAHPTWKMGKKISIDSATLMNKALEVIEAHFLFGIAPENIHVVIHRQSQLHSAVEFADGSFLGQMGTADMRIPIAHALFFPKTPSLPFPAFSLFGKIWTFEEVDEDRFPSITFAKTAIAKGKCAELNAANDAAVHQFLKGEIGFLDIFAKVRNALE